MGKRKEITWEIDDRGCYVCTSHTPNYHGYPMLGKGDGRRANMHHVLFAEAFGPVPQGLVVRHKCDNRRCINLDHLELGTPADNSKDMKERGRCNTPRGEKRSDAKLTLKQVKEIAVSRETQYFLAKKYGVNQSTISRIKSGKRWPDRE